MARKLISTIFAASLMFPVYTSAEEGAIYGTSKQARESYSTAIEAMRGPTFNRSGYSNSLQDLEEYKSRVPGIIASRKSGRLVEGLGILGSASVLDRAFQDEANRTEINNHTHNHTHVHPTRVIREHTENNNVTIIERPCNNCNGGGDIAPASGTGDTGGIVRTTSGSN